jgi:hypothetical protein
MKDRLATIEADVTELRKDMKAANEAVADVKNAVTAVEGKVTALEARFDGRFSAVDARFSELDARMDARNSALETKLIKWMIGTMIACTGAALAIAKAVPETF